MSKEIDSLSLGVPIQCMVRVKPPSGYQREDVRIHNDRISLLDVNNRVKEEYEIQDIFPAEATVQSIFETSFASYVRALSEGVNFAVFGMGSTNSGKTSTIEGEFSQPGLVTLMSDAIFNMMEDKRAQANNVGRPGGMGGDAFSYSIKIRYIEIIDEEITDLLTESQSRAREHLTAKNDEWEGVTVNGIHWLPVSNINHLVDVFYQGKKARTNAVNEFGNFSDKATSIFSVEIVQISELEGQPDATVLVSRAHFVDMPGAEVLNRDPEELRLKEGVTLNKGITTVANLLKELAAARRSDYIGYQGSQLSHLMKDILGGNSLTVGMFTLQHGDLEGSSLTMNLMKQTKRVMNFPVVNDNRLSGLLRKLRIEILHVENAMLLQSPDNIEGYNLKIAELEKKMIEDNLDKMRHTDDRKKLAERITELRDKYNDLVKSKAELQAELIKSEEEKLQVSKALIEMQIENTKLQELGQNQKYDISNKLLHAENDILNMNMKEEKAMQAIQELQEKLAVIQNEKKELEIEFVALKTNYMNTVNELKDERQKNENLGIELINLVNANKALTDDTKAASQRSGNIYQDYEKLQVRKDHLEKENRDINDALMVAKSENDRLTSEIRRYELKDEQYKLDIEEKRLELERGYLEMAQGKHGEVQKLVLEKDSAEKRAKDDKDLWDSDRVEILRKVKHNERRIGEMGEELSHYIDTNNELKNENKRLSLQLEEMRANYRGKLMKMMNEGLDRFDPKYKDLADETLLKKAREELIRAYTEKEGDLQERLDKLTIKNENLATEARTMKVYARKLKHLAEDWAPSGQHLPEVLTMPPKLLQLDENMPESHLEIAKENERLRDRVRKVEQELRMTQNQMMTNTENYIKAVSQAQNSGATKGGVSVNQRLEDEIRYLKGNERDLKRPGTGNVEVEEMRRERNALREEVRVLKQQMARGGGGGAGGYGGYGSGGGDVQQVSMLKKEIERLNVRIREYERMENAGPESGNAAYLKRKIYFLEKTMEQLEKERSELSMRSTMAEEQLKNMQEHMNTTVQNYQRKIVELKKKLKQNGVAP